MNNQAARKKLMLEALEKSMGIVSTAVKKAGINRKTHYDWMISDPKYKADVDALLDVSLDFAESQLLKSIRKGSDTATIFYLKTKGKGRGYVEKQLIDATTNGESLNRGFYDFLKEVAVKKDGSGS